MNKFYDCYFHNRISTTSPNPTNNPSSFLHHPFPFSNPLHLLCLSPSIHIHIHIQSTPKSIYPIDKKIHFHTSTAQIQNHIHCFDTCNIYEPACNCTKYTTLYPPSLRPPNFPDHICTIIHAYTQYRLSKS